METKKTSPPQAHPNSPHTNDAFPTTTTTTFDYNKQLLRTGAFADCTITCRNSSNAWKHSRSSSSSCCSSWPAHRNVLAPRCDFFRCCFEGAFREARTPCVVDMSGDDPVAVEGLLYYLYTLEYPREVYRRMLFMDTPKGNAAGSRCSDSDSGVEDVDEDEESKRQGQGLDARVYWGFDLLMHDVGDKYGLLALRKMAARSLIDKADLAGKYQGEEGEEKEEQFETTLDGFVALIENLYPVEEAEEDDDHGNDLTRALRRQVVSSACQGIASHIRNPRISSLLADIPTFAVELVEMLAQRGDERRLAQQNEEERQEALKVRMMHVPMNEESDCED